jgi:hypothetical protein
MPKLRTTPTPHRKTRREALAPKQLLDLGSRLGMNRTEMSWLAGKSPSYWKRMARPPLGANRFRFIGIRRRGTPCRRNPHCTPRNAFILARDLSFLLGCVGPNPVSGGRYFLPTATSICIGWMSACHA